MIGARLSGKRMLVTGGASGIGEAIIRRCVTEGASVVVADIASEPGTRLAEELISDGHAVCFQHTDVRDEDSSNAAVTQCIERFGGIDVLVNNAGWVKTDVAIRAQEADIDRMLAIYVKGYWRMAKAALPPMIAQHAGAIINMSSMQAIRAIPGRVGVQACKGAIGAITRELALEYGPAGVRVNAVLPGIVMTDKAKADYGASATPEELELRRICYPLRMMGEPIDIANATLFLASDEARWITGIDLLVDGGISIQLAEALVFPPFRRLWQEASPDA